MAAHPLITREPRRVRPPYDVPDEQFEHLAVSDPAAWRRARRLDRIAALAEPLAGLDVTDYEHRTLEYFGAGSEVHVVAVIAALLWRAREAAPPAAAAEAPVSPPHDGAHPVRARLVQDVLALLAAHGYRRPAGAASLAATLRALNALVEAFEGGR